MMTIQQRKNPGLVVTLNLLGCLVFSLSLAAQTNNSKTSPAKSAPAPAPAKAAPAPARTAPAPAAARTSVPGPQRASSTGTTTNAPARRSFSNGNGQPRPVAPPHGTPGAGGHGIAEGLAPGPHQMRDGGRLNVGANGNVTHVTPEGRVDYMRVQSRDHRGEEVIHRGPGGARVVETVRRAPDGRLVTRSVSFGGGHGFIEHPIFSRPGFIQRSYSVGGRQYAVVYRGHRYGGRDFYRPVPAYYYRPAFYGWATRPWGAPAHYAWGWQSEPWYGPYGHVFTPYPAYAGVDYWMTDYILSTNMQRAYEAGLNARSVDDPQGGPPPPEGLQPSGYASAPAPSARGGLLADGPPVITDELKAQIAAEVRAELAEQAAEASTGMAAIATEPTAADAEQLPDALKAHHTVFRLVSPLAVQVDGQPCNLNADDYVTRVSGMDPNDFTVLVQVSASRSTDCAKGATTSIALNDLMDMENDRDQQIREGMKVMADKMGTGGLPAGPPAGAQAFAAGQADPDSGLTNTLLKQNADSVAVEKEAAGNGSR